MPLIHQYRHFGRWFIRFVLATMFSLHVDAIADTTGLQRIDNFGNNPSALVMDVYVPLGVTKHAAVLLAIHFCGGSGQAFFDVTRFDELADQYGFIVIYPSEPSQRNNTNCFDASSEAALTGRGSDPVGLMSMVDYVRSHYSVDDKRIFVVGLSSGGMMTNVMLALYPKVFAAGAAFAGLPFTCFADAEPAGWNGECAAGKLDRTAQQWGDAVRKLHSGYAGPWPRMQIWHGTVDSTLNYANFKETVEQWTNVHGLSLTPDSTERLGQNTRTRFGGVGGQVLVEANSLEGMEHSFMFSDAVDGSLYAGEAIRFFGLQLPKTSGVSHIAAPLEHSKSGALDYLLLLLMVVFGCLSLRSGRTDF